MKFENPSSRKKGNNENKEDKEKHEAAMPRRDFLRFVLGGIAAGVVIQGGKKEGIAEATDIKTETYHEGIQRLRREAWSIPREQVYIYKRKRNNVEYWEKLDQGNATSGFIPSESLEDANKDDIERIEAFHTHTLSFMYPDFGDRDKARSGELPVLLMPPSFIDITGAIGLISEMPKKAAAKVGFKAADPGGVWEYLSDPASSFSQKIIQIQKEVFSIAQGDHQEAKEFMKKYNLLGEDTRLIFKQMVEKKNELSKPLRAVIEKMFSSQKELIGDDNIKQIIMIENSARGFRHDDPKLRELIQRYRTIGVTLTFTPCED